jgi:hypothetical protein
MAKQESKGHDFGRKEALGRAEGEAEEGDDVRCPANEENDDQDDEEGSCPPADLASSADARRRGRAGYYQSLAYAAQFPVGTFYISLVPRCFLRRAVFLEPSR